MDDMTVCDPLDVAKETLLKALCSVLTSLVLPIRHTGCGNVTTGTGSYLILEVHLPRWKILAFMIFRRGW